MTRIEAVAFFRNAEDDRIPASARQVYNGRCAFRRRLQKRREFFFLCDAQFVRAPIIEYRGDTGIERESSTILKWEGPRRLLDGHGHAFPKPHNGRGDVLDIVSVGEPHLVFSRGHDKRQWLLVEVMNGVDDGDVPVALRNDRQLAQRYDGAKGGMRAVKKLRHGASDVASIDYFARFRVSNEERHRVIGAERTQV